jgi:hypothetical protein
MRSGRAKARARRSSRLAILRPLVVFPGAVVESAMTVSLPWMLANEAGGTVWLPILSASGFAARLRGAILAPVLERRVARRRMTLGAGYTAAAALPAAWACLQLGTNEWAFAVTAVSIVADAACDVGFAAHLPLLARLARQRLERFSRVISCGRSPAQPLAVSRRALRGLNASGATVRITIGFAALIFVTGPIDNLPLPMYVSANGADSGVFAQVMGASGLGQWFCGCRARQCC